MKHKGQATLKVIVLIVLTDMLEALTQLLLKFSAETSDIKTVTLANWPHFVGDVVTSFPLWVAIFCLILNFILWMIVLSRIDLSAAYPIGSTSYLFVTLLSILILKESVPPLRWVGIALIMGGIYFITKSTHPKDPCPNDN